jgi:hypothetical protein
MNTEASALEIKTIWAPTTLFDDPMNKRRDNVATTTMAIPLTQAPPQSFQTITRSHSLASSIFNQENERREMQAVASPVTTYPTVTDGN